MAAVTWNIFMPRPGSRVTERNSGLLPPELALRASVSTSSPPIFMTGGAAGCGACSAGVAGGCVQPAASSAKIARIPPNLLLPLCIDTLKSLVFPVSAG